MINFCYKLQGTTLFHQTKHASYSLCIKTHGLSSPSQEHIATPPPPPFCFLFHPQTLPFGPPSPKSFLLCVSSLFSSTNPWSSSPICCFGWSSGFFFFRRRRVRFPAWITVRGERLDFSCSSLCGVSFPNFISPFSTDSPLFQLGQPSRGCFRRACAAAGGGQLPLLPFLHFVSL